MGRNDFSDNEKFEIAPYLKPQCYTMLRWLKKSATN